MRPLIGACDERGLDRGKQPVLRRVDVRAWDVAGLADRFEPGRRAIVTDRGRADHLPARRFEFANAGGVEGMDGRHRRAIERAVEFAPFAGRNRRPRREAEQIQHPADLHRIDREHLSQQRDSRLFAARGPGRLHRPALGFEAREIQHRAGKHILRLGVGRHAKPRHVDADDADAVDLLRQQAQGNAGSRRHTEIDDDDGIIFVGVRELECGFAYVLEQLAGDQRFGIERYIPTVRRAP